VYKKDPLYKGISDQEAEAMAIDILRQVHIPSLLSAIPGLGTKRKGHVKLRWEVPTPINLLH
jgi:hypothetical protein